MRVRLIFLIATMAFLLTGCWDRREINDVAFVAATAFDKAKKGYKVAVQIPLPGQMGGASGGGGGTSGEKKWYIDSEIDKTIRGANEKQQKRLSRTLNFSHRRVLVFGEDLAKEGILPIIDVLIRTPQNRLTSFPVVTRGKGIEILGAQAPIEQFPSEMLRELAVVSLKKPYMLNVLMYHLLTEGIDPVLPTMKLVKSKPGSKETATRTIEYEGIAIFKKDKLVKILEKDQALSVLWLTNLHKAPTVTISAPDQKGRIVLQFQQTTVDIKPSILKDQVSAKIIVKAKGSVLENTSGFQTAKYSEQVEKQTEKKIKQIMQGTLKTLQELEADPIGIGDSIHRKDMGYWKKINKDWRKIYKKMDIAIEVDVRVEHTGTVIKNIIRKEMEVKP